MMENRLDEIGKIKDLSEIAVAKVAKIIKKGKVFDLGMEINEYLSGRNEGVFPFTMLFESTPEDTEKSFKKLEKNSRISSSNEVIISSTHCSTHIDALCHMHLDGRVINKFNVEDIRTKKGWEKCGAETIPPIVGRGILLDIAKYLGKEKLEDDHIIGLDEVKNYLKDKKIRIEFGDIVCIRTGTIKDFYSEDYFRKAPGIGSEAANWMAEQGMCVLCSDHIAIDPLPFRDFNNTTHVNMIYRNSIYLIEAVNLDELSNENVLEFFMICSAPKLTGCSGSWVRPVAII